MAKKQINRINLGPKVSKKQRIRMEQESADNELVLKYFFGALVFFFIIAIIIMTVF